MKKLMAASRNKGKLNEIRDILAEFPFEVISMEEAGISEDIAETGSTFEENALLKAYAIHEITDTIVMADDSGLEVDWLNGAPGVYTNRFAGENASDLDKMKKLTGLLQGVPFEKRTARFTCVIAVVLPDAGVFTVKGSCEGYIAQEPAGDNGFGYDPVFYLKEYGKTMAQLDDGLKNTISHRAKALALMVHEFKKINYK